MKLRTTPDPVPLFLKLLPAKGLPVPVREHRFAAPDRDWRFDLAWVEPKVALEVEGGIWRKGGGAHSHPSNITRDIEKYNRAVVLGWRILRVPPEQLCTPSTFNMLAEVHAPGAINPEGWRGELLDWLARGPTPHDPPGDSRSVYGWLKEHGERIAAGTRA